MKSGSHLLLTTLALAFCASTAPAQTTVNYYISSAGYLLSQVTWTITGSLATPPGALRVTPSSTIALSVNAPGIFAAPYEWSRSDFFFGSSYFQADNGNTSSRAQISSYSAYNAPGSDNDSFGLSALIGPQGGLGLTYLYYPRGESTFIFLDISEFNPGTYQSEQLGFDTPITVILTVVPEPAAPLLLLAGAFAAIARLRTHPNEAIRRTC